MILILIANMQTSHSLNMHMQLSSRTRVLNFGLEHASSEGVGEFCIFVQDYLSLGCSNIQ